MVRICQREGKQCVEKAGRAPAGTSNPRGKSTSAGASPRFQQPANWISGRKIWHRYQMVDSEQEIKDRKEIAILRRSDRMVPIGDRRNVADPLSLRHSRTRLFRHGVSGQPELCRSPHWRWGQDRRQRSEMSDVDIRPKGPKKTAISKWDHARRRFTGVGLNWLRGRDIGAGD